MEIFPLKNETYFYFCRYHMFQVLNTLLNGPSIIFIHHMDDILHAQYDSTKLQEDFPVPQTIISDTCLKTILSPVTLFTLIY